MKTLLVIAMATLLALGAGGTMTWQSGGTAPTTVPVCELPDCLQTTTHTHSVCAVSYCSQSTDHEHDGIIYFARHEGGTDGDQQSAPAPAQAPVLWCEVSGCTETNEHSHNRQDESPVSPQNSSGLFNCGVSGCNNASDHTHSSCGISGCDNTGNHSHENRGGGQKS